MAFLGGNFPEGWPWFGRTLATNRMSLTFLPGLILGPQPDGHQAKFLKTQNELSKMYPFC